MRISEKVWAARPALRGTNCASRTADGCNADRTLRYLEPAQGVLPELEAKAS